MSKLFKNLWFWVILLHLIVIVAWYYLAKITPDPTYTEPAAQDGSVGVPPASTPAP